MLNHHQPRFVCHKCDKGLSSHQSLWCHTQKYADNPTIKDFVREVSSNDIGVQDFPRKRLWDDCAGLNAAYQISKPFKSPKIQSLLDEIINDNLTKEKSISQGSSQKTELLQKKVKPLAEVKVLPT